ncbi:rhodanese-like domain-containing protein [Afifella marina]|uniref:Rhodanese-related sulfurtransferase n=1 Tax=Afifella marina DSM 2698 TaxID=1120955 RepID=A0A1G5NP95_AFIMA|nr:rhodanese-like domain-containing protein [Afifella marina]MBK1624651.1 rhodanese-like domain-containing protein [Afifella marina DSM 2698]MBK1627544.1 rhodanese-like domain-containing protein [Afifella marina]MBK5918602.1 sulfurtransferase [Afifella marina]RAI18499.1 sulfurtransferase [Afifella marina DSM 2698]SCZ38571.1 Rhodanese-related sulfurtransferase [Afifella marina DSM 2698]
MSKTEDINGVPFETMTPQEVRKALDAHEIVLIDVRTPAEFAFERIPGALLAPMSELDADNLPTQTDKPVVFHCGSGKRSELVSRKAIEAGFTKAAHLEGGLAAWKQAGLPLITTDFATGQPKRVGS